MTTGAVVIGVGNRFRHDDAVGPRVVDLLAASPVGGRARLVELDGEPSRLVEAWAGAGVAVVVDAVSSGEDPPGTIRRLELPDLDAVGPGQGGTHGLGVGTAAALGRAVGRMPGRLVVLGVEGADFGLGEGISPEVRRVVGEVARLVAEEVEADE